MLKQDKRRFMYNLRTFFISLLFFMLLLLSVSFVLTRRTQKARTNTLHIVCTTSIITDTVKNIAGDLAHVESLMGPGIDPHLYKARESDTHTLFNADIIFYNGLHLEGKIISIFEHLHKTKKCVAVGKAIPHNQLLFSEESIADPHIWHDVNLWIYVVQLIATTLIEYDPANARYYKQNEQNYITQLSKLDLYVKEQISLIPQAQRILVTAHDAFSYFGRSYGMQVVGLQGISTDAEISTTDVQNLIALILEKKIKAIFVESAIPQRSLQAVQQAAAARSWSVALGDPLYSDALSGPDQDAGTYIDMITYNVDAMVNKLQ